MTDLVDARRRAWITRRERYGPRGNNGAYTRARSREATLALAAVVVWWDALAPSVRKRMRRKLAAEPDAIARARRLAGIAVDDLLSPQKATPTERTER